MEKSLGDVLCPSRGKGGKSSKSSKGSKSGKNGKSGKSGKTTKSPKASKSTSSSKVPKVELPAQKQQVVPAGSQKTGKGQPTPVTQMGMQVVKMPSPAIREAAEMCVSPPVGASHSAPWRDVAARRLRHQRRDAADLQGFDVALMGCVLQAA